MNVKLTEFIHVGDSPLYDKDIPESVGIKSFLLDPSGKGDIRSLLELKKYL